MSIRIAALGMIFTLASLVYGGPNTITYQGCVMNSDGTPVADGNYSMRFSIYLTPSGGTLPAWQETKANVSVTNGLFSTTLGNGPSPLGPVFAANAQLWLEVAIDLNHSWTFQSSEIYSPRHELAGAAWAIDADMLDGKHATDLGDITGVSAGTGLTGGGTSGSLTLSADTTYLQRRVTGTALPGRFIRAIDADGTVVTDVDRVGTGTITGVVAGVGLLGGGTSGDVELSASPTYLQCRVTEAAPAGQFIRAINQDGSIVTAVDRVNSGTITGVVAGAGLAGGGTSGTIALSADTDYLQRRVTAMAPTSQFIRAINADGSIVTTNAITGVVAGSGLAGGGTSGSVTIAADTAYLQRRVSEMAPVAQFIQGINEDGSIVTAGAVTDVVAGAGLAGGGTSSSIVLMVLFGGSGRATTAARSDHTHADIGWSLTGNLITSGTHFLGTTNNAALDLRVANTRGLRIEPTGGTPNLIGGYNGNGANVGVQGAAIGGGGIQFDDSSASGLNCVTDDYGTISGGLANRAGGGAAVGGGWNNAADGVRSTIAGGWRNTVSADYGSIVGGYCNIESGYYGAVGGGYYNISSGTLATIAGGGNNRALGQSATIAGGSFNLASGTSATVAGGFRNAGTAPLSSIGGGGINVANGYASAVGGGNYNTAAGMQSVVSGGQWNLASADYGTIVGGYGNVESGYYGAVGGGYCNTSSGTLATIAGGGNNRALGQSATIAGGSFNLASGTSATVAGGFTNSSTAPLSSIGGGGINVANGYASTVGGGEHNTAGGDWSTIAGGTSNTATGACATVAGGTSNTAGGNYSFATGRQARANHAGSFVWADSNAFDFSSTVNDEFSVRATGGVRFVTGIDAAGNPTAGVQLTSGGIAWSALSDRNIKENFADVDRQDILVRLAAIPVQTWNAKSQSPAIRHIGPMAQDFYTAFGVGEDDRHINSVDADGVALAAIQGLYKIVREKIAEIAAVKGEKDTQIAALVAEKNAQQQRIADLETQLVAQRVQNATVEARLATLEHTVTTLAKQKP
jgi:hypothetical protein